MTTEICTFTDDDIAVGPILGPEYRASQRWAEGVMSMFQEEHIKPIIDSIAEQVRDKLWDDARNWLLADTECNVAGAVRDMVEQTIKALLKGDEWAMQRYPYADYAKGEAIRKAVAVHGGDKLLMARIGDLEAEIAKKEEIIKLKEEIIKFLCQ